MSGGDSPAKIAIVCSTSGIGSVARAVCLFLVSQELAETRIFALDDGPLWPGAQEVRDFVTGVSDEKDLHAALDGYARGQHITLWHVKPFGTTLRWSDSYAKTRTNSATLLVDVDDEDQGMNRLYQTTRIGRNPLREGSPERVKRSLSSLRGRVRMSVNSHALDTYLGLNASLILPQVRKSHPRLDSPSNLESPKFGFFGTLRQHKGLSFFKDFIPSSGRDYEFHFFEDPTTTRAFRGFENVTLHKAGAEDLINFYQLIDVVLLPQWSTGSGFRYQTPAKLSDALQFRRVIIATATPPILEWAQNAIEPVAVWNDGDVVWKALESARRRHADHTARVDAAFSRLTVESQLPNVRSFLGLDKSKHL